VNFDIHEDIRMPIEDPDLIEKGLSYAASLANYTLSQGISTGFGCNGYYVEPFTNKTDPIKPSIRVEPSNGGQQVGYILDAIAKVKMDRSRNFRAFLDEDIQNGLEKTDIIIFTPHITEKMRAQAARLEGLGNAIEFVELETERKEEAGETHAS